MYPMNSIFDIIYIGKKIKIQNCLRKIDRLKIKSIFKKTEAIIEEIVINIDTCMEKQ